MTNYRFTILVPQGAEYKAVCRGLKAAQAKTPDISTPLVFPIPVGVKPLTEYLEKWLKDGHFSNHQPKVLLMGLCGSLTPSYGVGDVVLYESCAYSGLQDELWRDPRLLQEVGDLCTSLTRKALYGENTALCDRSFNSLISNRLKSKVSLVQALTSDRIIYSAAEKQHLANTYNAEVVDMEGFAALEVLGKAGISVAMLRVISDDCDRDLPNLNSAISADGKLKSLPLAMGMLRQPMAAFRLIKGSLNGLRVLHKVAYECF